jgi:hypothetical protein
VRIASKVGIASLTAVLLVPNLLAARCFSSHDGSQQGKVPFLKEVLYFCSSNRERYN